MRSHVVEIDCADAIVTRARTPGATRFRAGNGLDLFLRVADQVSYPTIENAAEGFVELEFRLGLGIELLNFVEKSAEHRNFISDLFQGQQAGLVAIIEVGGA